MRTGETLRRYCKRTGMNYHTIYTRLDKFGMTPDEVVKTSTRKYGEYILEDGRPLKQACKDSDIPYTSVLNSVSKGKETLQQSFNRLYERRMKRVRLFR